MAFNVDSWRGQIKENLPASMYEVAIYGSPVNGRDITIRAETVTAPGVSWLSVDNYSPYGNGKMYNIPYRFNPQEITVTHTVDDEGSLLRQFKDWADKIVDMPNPKMGALYYKDYVAEMDIYVYNRQGKTAKTYNLEEVFPMTVEPLTLSWGSHDEIARFAVTYRFTKFKIVG
jgi:hypothetical protein